MNSRYKMLGLASLVGLGTLPFVAFRTYPGNPRWPSKSGLHYIATLHPTSFRNGSAFQLQARKALFDWHKASIGGTSHRPGYRVATGDIRNHNDGINMWAFTRSSSNLLGLAFSRFSRGRMTDCDVWFNTRFPWAALRKGPCTIQSPRPYSFRGVARKMVGHALGLEVETRVLNQMHRAYTNGTSISHLESASTSFSRTGCLPHADDKAGVRFLYPRSDAAYNFMATDWTSGSTIVQRRVAGFFRPGQFLRIPVVTLENQSNRTQLSGNGSTGIRVGIYLSTNAIISPADTKIGEYFFVGNWPAHRTQSFTTLGGRIPSNLAAGTYHVGTIFDCPHGTSTDWDGVRTEGPRSAFETFHVYGADNACETGLIKILKTVDLQPIGFSVSSTSFVPNATYRFTSTTRNNGNSTAPASTNGYYMSADSTISTSDRLLLSFALPVLSRGTARTHTANVRMPASLSSGRCYPGVYVDRSRSIAETSETNNARVGRASVCIGRPDLVVSSLAAPSSLPAGGTITVRTTTRNIGTAAATTTTTGIYFSTNPSISPRTDDFLGSYSTGTLGAGASTTVTTRHTLSFCRRLAVCYIGAYADSGGALAEVSEGNNWRSQAASCLAYAGSGRFLNYLRPMQNQTQGPTSYTSARVDTRQAGGASICITAPRYPRHWYFLFWSRSSGAFAFDDLGSISLALAGTPIFGAWIGRTDSAGSATATFRWPRGASLNATAYTHSLWFDGQFTRFVGFGHNVLSTRLAP